MLDLFACPRDGGRLEALGAGLGCGACAAVYPVVRGIPSFVPAAENSAQTTERAWRDRYLSFAGTRRDRYERRIEREAVLRRLDLGPKDTVLDAGCGVGGITRYLVRSGAQVVGVDFSRPRLEFLRDQVGVETRLELAVADLTQLPFAPGTFSVIVSTQVLEHLPGAATRQALLAGFHRLLRPGGSLVMTVYNYSQPWRNRGQAREGRHETGIYYHCYDAEELERELAGFEVEEICGIVQLLPHTYRLFAHLGGWAAWLDHRLERNVAVSRNWGHLLLARAMKPGKAEEAGA